MPKAPKKPNPFAKKSDPKAKDPKAKKDSKGKKPNPFKKK